MSRRDPLRATASRLERPDYTLTAIAAAVLTGVGAAGLTPASSTLALSVSSVVALALIPDALFRNPPRTTETPTSDFGGARPEYLRNVEYDSGCVEVWDHLSEVRYGA
ncbi:hypothetical protein [Salarchaeum japonicum]|uniref:hypothetical protein n=1 Tax=Salarchaeum japonicum TaxID=555573 RepID=UPI003C78FAD7